jgi:putative hydrolase of the HAD superfamily
VTALAGIGAITFDFGNTLLKVDRATLRAVVDATAREAVGRLGPFEVESFLDVWAEERDRQFREEVPNFREVDLGERLVRVLARLRGMAPPAVTERWDQPAAAALSAPDEIAWGVAAYSDAFVRHFAPDPAVSRTLAALAESRTLAILSNWPHAATVDRFVEAAGWAPLLAAVVVSQRVGTIKPHPAIFEAARTAIGNPDPASILHVGDDWAADVVGAAAVGWRVAYLVGGGHDSPLPTSSRDGTVEPDLEIASIHDLPGLLGVTDGSPRRRIRHSPD